MRGSNQSKRINILWERFHLQKCVVKFFVTEEIKKNLNNQYTKLSYKITGQLIIVGNK